MTTKAENTIGSVVFSRGARWRNYVGGLGIARVRSCIPFVLLALWGCGSPAPETFRIDPVRPVEELLAEAMLATPPVEEGEFDEPDLVELIALDPSLRLDIRYATTNNFMGAAFYAEPRAFLQRPAAEALVRVHERLRGQGYGLLVFDAYRPWYVTKTFWDATPEHQKHFVGDPSRGSVHNRGAAVDVTLIDLRTGEPVEMPSGYVEFTERAYADYPGATARQRRNREILREAMEAEGFVVYPYEWWHFDYQGGRYPIMNVRFDEIRSMTVARGSDE